MRQKKNMSLIAARINNNKKIQLIRITQVVQLILYDPDTEEILIEEYEYNELVDKKE